MNSSLLFVFLFLFSLISCQSLPIIPGCADSYIARGYDLYADSPRDSIVSFTYTCDEPWSNPYDGRKLYCVPDEAIVMNIGQTQGKDEPYFFSSISDYSNQILIWFDVSNKTANGTNAISGKTDIITTSLKSGQYSVVLQYRAFYFYSLKLWPGLDASRFFTMALDNLPLRHDTPQEKLAYRNFVKQFGSHFISRVTLGGRFEIVIIVENSLFRNKTNAWVQTEITKAINAAKNQLVNISYSDLDEEFVKKSKIITNFIGGDESLVTQTDGYTKWLGSIPRKPATLKRSLETYANRDFVKNNAKRALLQEAIDLYLAGK